MLENWRYNRAVQACSIRNEPDTQHLYLDQEYRTQQALTYLHVRENTSPKNVEKAGCMLMRPELIPTLRLPYAVEIVGMPGAGKTTMINRYVAELWQRNQRNFVALADEGSGEIKEKYGNLRYSNPFEYSLLAGTAAFCNQLSALAAAKSGMRMILSDRGQIDRRVFRRALFGKGDVSPSVMEDEEPFIQNLESPPVQTCAIVLLMSRPQQSLERISKSGPVVNPDFLQRLYEQYWRLHYDVLHCQLPYRIYSCIDAEGPHEEVYLQFRHILDTALNVHSIYLSALLQAFPNLPPVDTPNKTHLPKSQAETILGRALGKKVLIVGGDDMQTKEDILRSQLIEGL